MAFVIFKNWVTFSLGKFKSSLVMITFNIFYYGIVVIPSCDEKSCVDMDVQSEGGWVYRGDKVSLLEKAKKRRQDRKSGKNLKKQRV